MKKFLFTLAALLMAGSICADEYLYIEDFEVAQNQLGKNITVNVKAHFDYAVSAYQCNLTIPEGMTLRSISKGSAITGLTALDEWGDEVEVEGLVFTPNVSNTNFAAAIAQPGYYEVDGEYVTYGSVKWLAGEYDQMVKLTINVAADFNGGNIVVTTMPACGDDARPEVEPCPKNQTYEKTCVVTVEGGSEPEVTEKPVITSENDDEAQVTRVTATGNGHICLYVEDILVAEGDGTATYDIAYSELEEEYGVSATAQEEGKEVSEYALATIYVPAATVTPPEPEKTATPEIKFEVNEEEQYVDIWAEGEGTIKLYIDGMQVANHFHYAFQEEEDVVHVTATAQEEGKEISDEAELDVTIPAKAEEPPVTEQTEKPVITSENDDEAQVTHVTATGNGHIILMWDEQVMAEGNGTATWDIPYGEMEEEYGVSATAQEEGKEVSEPAVATIYVPAAAVLPPEPYETPAPELTYVVNDDAVVFTATGEGTVTIYINVLRAPEAVATGEGEATYSYPRGEEDVYVAAWATAQRDDDALVGISETEYVLIPALEEVGPEDPHDTGVWLVVLTQDGEEVWNEMDLTEDHYSYFLSLDYDTYGTYGYDAGEDRPDVEMYVVVDGVVMGAPEAGQVVDIAEPANNILEETENNYVLEEALGRIYQMGVYTNSDGEKYLVASPMPDYTGIDELLNGKTVAGVRYFNMAGQEMQEANGVTIVVTTYTDGTTSAVKVIK